MKEAALYVDTSALMRILFDGEGERAPIDRRHVTVSSVLTELEAFRFIENAHRRRAISDLELVRKTKELTAMIRKMHLFPIGDEVVQIARTSFATELRAVDAIHIATAQVVAAEGPVELWTHDQSMAAAALTRGLEVRGALVD